MLSISEIENEKTIHDIIKGALRELDENMISGSTVKNIGHRTGFSTGIIYYYFETKDNLTSTTFKYLINKKFKVNLEKFHKEPDPKKRILAMLHDSVSSSGGNIWLCFFAEANKNKKVLGLLRILHSRFRSNLIAEFRKIGLRKTDAVIASQTLLGITTGMCLLKSPLVLAKDKMSLLEIQLDNLTRIESR